jgi:ubiquinone/menaquinone biosynthesis C-methylase UbiE
MSPYIFSRQEKLILDLVSPVAGESLLQVGCGQGNYLGLFRREKCLLTGLDSSADVLEQARIKFGASCELVQGNAASLPFSDNEFDIVMIMNGPRILDDPQKVLAEAVRVSRNRVFVCFYNRHSFACARQSIWKLLDIRSAPAIRLFSIREMKSIIHQVMANPYLTWGSVIYFPGPVYKLFSEPEELFPMRKNPLGMFVGMAFPVRYTYRTLQNPLRDSLELKAKARTTVPESVRSMLREGDR